MHSSFETVNANIDTVTLRVAMRLE
jgi:hypothetical protein